MHLYHERQTVQVYTGSYLMRIQLQQIPGCNEQISLHQNHLQQCQKIGCNRYPFFFYQNFTQNSAGITFCGSKPGPCVVITSQISSKFRGLVVYYLLSMPPLVFLVSMLQIVQNFRRK